MFKGKYIVRACAFAAAMFAGVAMADNVVEYSSAKYLQQQYVILKERMRPLEVVKGDDFVKVYVPSEYGFKVGQADLSRTLRDKLNDLGAYLNYYNESKISVFGHTDSVGSYDYNKQLSKKRALAVAEQLIVGGVNPLRLSIVPESFEVPKCKEVDSVSRECNRRVEIDIELDPEVYR
ncbi:OmpA family protein [Vibrio owensii]|uniref:OmpA family protein n=1 Tax=Vibrio owensii TaxID=696485 RepID=UPI0018F11E24|nr:OmpA family protein [Vibrio owensii]